MRVTQRLFLTAKFILFPGTSVATRKRMRLARHLASGDIATLDAGCGNGAFSFAAMRRGNHVLGIDSNTDKLNRCEEFRDFLGITKDRCQFRVLNIFEVPGIGRQFDQVICFETLEHIMRDKDALETLVSVLKPGGWLHLGTPYGRRRPYYGETISAVEDGGHVRLGYTFEQFEEMLTPLGCHVVAREFVVGVVSQKIEDLLRWVVTRPLRRVPSLWRETVSLPILLLAYPLTMLDSVMPGTPLCVYVKARKDGKQRSSASKAQGNGS